MPPYKEKHYLQILRNTQGINSYLGLFALRNFFFKLIYI